MNVQLKKLLLSMFCSGRKRAFMLATGALLLSLSVKAQTNISGIINSYAPVTSITNTGTATTCNATTAYTDFTVGTVTGNGGAFAAGDTVMVIQMQGASATTTNGATFGGISAYNQAGQYEITSVISATATNIRTLRTLNNYNSGAANGVQLVKVRSYKNANVSATLTALAWNGSTGGVLALYVTGTLTLNASIDVSGLGFRGGATANLNNTTCATSDATYFYASTSTGGANKGEGIASLPIANQRGRGAWTNGGGGGNAYNAGGGGGSNIVGGGFGGYQRQNCGSNTLSRGIGGYALTSTSSRLFMGGGGGAGFGNSSTVKTGGNGGGIVFIKAQTLLTSTGSILANGTAAANTAGSATDGAGGGGGGGAVMLNVNSYTNSLTVQATGGKGGNTRSQNNNANALYGPGGGGSGGLIRLNAALPATLTATRTGGLNGTGGSTPNDLGATEGTDGTLETNGTIVQTACALSVSISGIVYNDSNGSTDNLINGTATNTIGTNTLYANLLNSAGTSVLASVAVATNGTYTFDSGDGVFTGTSYNISISNVIGTVGQAPPSRTLTGAVNTAEGTTGTGDGTANGLTAVTISTASVSAVNFGIDRNPVATAPAALATQANPGSTYFVSVPASNFAGTDAEDITVSKIKFYPFPTNVTSINLGGTISNGVVTGGATYTSFTASGVTVATGTTVFIDPAAGALTASIPFMAVDNAGKESSSASLSVPFSELTISGKVYNDLNGTTDNLINGTATNVIGSNTLYANLLNAAGTLVLASSAVAANGSFSFGNANGIQINTTYNVSITKTIGTVGQAGPATTLTGAVNTAEGTTGTGDGIPNGITSISSTSNSIVVNFGINRIPVASSMMAASSLNPGGATSTSVSAAYFTGTDPDGGAIASINYSVFPTNITSITIGSSTYNFMTWPAAGVTVASGTAVSIDPVDGTVTADIPFKVVDNGGQKSTNTGFVSVPFSSSGSSSTICDTDPDSGTSSIAAASSIVNAYYPGQGNPVTGAQSLVVGAQDVRGATSETLEAGDLVVIMQMQGADLNTTNTDAYGNAVAGGTASGNLTTNLYAGYYEYNTVAEVNVVGATTTITMAYPLANNYYTRSFSTTTGIQKYQVIRIPRYYNLEINSGSTVTAPAWNGSTGGVVILNAANTITLNGAVDVSAKGFRGGGGKQLTGAVTGNTNGTTTLANTDYRWNSPMTTAANLTGGAKGEGIAGTPAYILANGQTTVTTNTGIEGYINGSMGRGAPGNAGGGGTDGSPVGATSENQYNTGGGGGGNGGAGGLGGSGWHGGTVAPLNATKFPYGGHGGSGFAQTALTRVVLGGGGGAGTANNSTAADEYRASGGTGGGIIIIRAKTYSGSGQVVADGGNAPGLSTANAGQTDAAGGGGAGGTVILATTQNSAAGLNWISVSAKGGKGGDAVNHYDHGPGGGGGGGIIYYNGTVASTDVSGGLSGKTRSTSATGSIDNTYGAANGSAGLIQSQGTTAYDVTTANMTIPCNTLPVTMTSFNGRKKDANIQLTWTVSNALNFDVFEVEFSTDGRNYLQVGNVAYQNGLTGYQFMHRPDQDAIAYYRLKLKDLDGTYEYSKVVSFDLRNKLSKANTTVYPNPTAGDASVIIESSVSESIELQVWNTVGKLISSEKTEVTAGQNTIPVFTQKLTPGIYFIKISGKENQANLKLQKLK